MTTAFREHDLYRHLQGPDTKPVAVRRRSPSNGNLTHYAFYVVSSVQIIMVATDAIEPSQLDCLVDMRSNIPPRLPTRS